MSVKQHLMLHELTLEPSSDWASRHEGWIILRVGSGVGYWLKPSGQAAEFGTGDVMMAHCLRTPVLRVSQLGPVKVQFFLLQPQLLSGLLSIDELQALAPGKNSHQFEPLFFGARESAAVRFGGLVEMTDQVSAAARIRRLQFWIDMTAKTNLPIPAAGNPELPLRDRFRSLVRRMSAGDLAGHSLAELAGELGCSTRHFHRLFREEFGESLSSFQTNLRLARARKFLAESNTKIINVAQESGYNHLGLFNSMFKRRFGMTPGDWRRKARKEPGRRLRRHLAAR